MKTLFKAFVTALLTVLLTGAGALAQERPAYSQAELDQMLAPIALYPDPLLSQILMASTYPLEVVQAARWSRANAPLEGEAAVRAVEPMDWDPSVKSLVAFPRILDRMDEQLDWTERLGEAFIMQEPQVMDTIQELRQRAYAAGNLVSGEEMRIVRDGRYIDIEPASPQVVYVPYYDPFVVYGTWWWPAYRPVYWAPWPGYHVRKTYAPRLIWGSAIVFQKGFFFGQFIWTHRYVAIVPPKRANLIVHHDMRVIHSAPAPRSAPVRWKHDPHRRNGASLAHTERRDSKPVHRVKSAPVLHLDGAGHVLNPPRKAPPAASLRTNAQPTRPSRVAQDSSVKQTEQRPSSTMRTAPARKDAERPAATVRIGVSASQAFASRNRNTRAVENNSASARTKESTKTDDSTGDVAKSPSNGISSRTRFGTPPSARASNARSAFRASAPMLSPPAAVGLR